MSEETTSAAIKELNEFLLKVKPKDKVIWITKKGIYELDYNYNPPRVTKIKEEE